PQGQQVTLMSQCVQGYSLPGVDLTFDDDAPTLLPKANAVTSGAYKPTRCTGNDPLPSPAPRGPYPYPPALSVFKGADPNGTWSLYVSGLQPNVRGDPFRTGTISGGWRVNITTSDPVCCSQPCGLSCPASITRASEPG